MCSMQGKFTMGIMGLGWSPVSGLRRVLPTAMVTAFFGWPRTAGTWEVGNTLRLGPGLARGSVLTSSVSSAWVWIPRRA